MYERFNEKARRAVFFARYEASQFGSNAIEPEHMLLGLLHDEDWLGSDVPLKAGLEIRKRLESTIPRGVSISTSVDLPVSPTLQRILARAVEEAEELQCSTVDPTHILLAILQKEDSLAAKILNEQGLRYETCRQAVQSLAPTTLDAPLQRLNQLVNGAFAHLDGCDETYGEEMLKGRQWSRKQALGHLVDWAAAHQQWIARALDEPKVVARGYPSDDWVASQQYATFAWRDLVDLWASLNRLLFHVIAHIPEAKLDTPCRMGIAAPVPLSQLIERYMEHCERMVGEILTPSS